MRKPQLDKRIDLTGRRVNHLRVLRPVTDRDGCLSPPAHHGRWLCVCDCGRRVAHLGHYLRDGRAYSCGCQRRVRKRTPQLRLRIDLTGRRVNRLRVLAPVTDRDGCLGPNGRWLCRCDCGREVARFGASLRAGRAYSCGCHRPPAGRARMPEYKSWCRIAKGGDCCARWARGFDAFLSDMGARPVGQRLFRRDPRRPFGPNNCAWVPRDQWAGHRIMLSYRGRALSMAEWARRFGITHQGLSYMLKSGVPMARLVARYEGSA